MIMEPEFAAHLQNNDPPSEKTICKIKETLLEPSMKLSEIQEELRRLDQLTQSLKQDEERIRSFIKPYDTILAPIRRIPADILHEIFYQCLSTHRNPIMDITEAPMLLTRVCRSWRSIALSSPRIWSKLHIQYPLLREDLYQHRPVTDTEQIQRGIWRRNHDRVTISRAKMIKLWLDRSGDCPLSMTVICQEHIEEPTSDTFPTTILEAFLPYTRRWRTLELIVTSQFYDTLRASISTDMLPVLETLRLYITDEKSSLPSLQENGHGPIRGNFLKAAKLKQLSLFSVSSTWNFHSMPPIWNQLSYLYLHSALPETHLLLLLSQCSYLTKCRISVIQAWNTEDQSYELPARSIVLPFLHTFIVHDTATTPVMSAVFKAIQAPILNRLSYTRNIFPSSTWNGGEGIMPTRPSPILHLLEASPIEKLMLDMHNVAADTVSDILKVAHHTNHLVFDRNRLNGSHTFRPMVSQHLDLYDLNLLTIENPSEGLDDILLPNLQILEAYGISNFSDEDLLAMIKSRLNAFKHGRTSALKVINIQFHRVQEKDVEEEIHRYAKNLGIGIDLEVILDYWEALPKYLEPLSSSYGLQHDGRSWHPAGADDELVHY